MGSLRAVIPLLLLLMFAAFLRCNPVGGSSAASSAPASPDAGLTAPPATPPSSSHSSHGTSSPCSHGTSLADCLATVLDGRVTVTAAGELSRPSGEKRQYITSRKRKVREDRPQEFVPIDSIMDGSAFGDISHISNGPDGFPAIDDPPPPSCCKKRCNEEWDAEAMERARSALPNRGLNTQTARKVYVRECFSPGDNRLHVRDGLVSMPVCRRYYRALMGTSFNLITSAAGVGPVGMRKRNVVQSASQLIVVWLLDMSTRWELQPDKAEIHMAFPTKLMVYNLFCASPTAARLDRIPVYSTFCAVWNARCSHIKLKKAMRFTKCDVCTLANEALDERRRKGGASWKSKEYEIILQNLLDHYEDVERSRRVYLAAKERARNEPKSLLCIAIDGSDQSSYAAPYFRQETKDTSKGWKMRMKLIGALVTGRMCMFYTILGNWESGSNLTIQVLHSTLVALMATLEDGQALPRTLYLQMDNCSRENKNRNFLAYLHILVYFGVFDSIELHFGLKGHTHDEIDQVFSRVGTGLRQRDAPTRSTLGDGILASYMAGHANFHVGIEHLYNLANIRDLLVGNMFPIPSVTKPQAFRISRDPTDNEVKMQVQRRSYNDDWGVIDRYGTYSQGYMVIMKTWPDLRDTPPHPRKTVEEATLKQHRLCIEAAEPRITRAAWHGVLPEGVQAADQVNSHMDELYKCVEEISKSTPVDCDWVLDMYNLPPLPAPEQSNGSGGGEDGSGSGEDGSGSDGGDGSDGVGGGNGSGGDGDGQGDGAGGVGLGAGVGGAGDETGAEGAGAGGGGSSEPLPAAGSAPGPSAGPQLRVEVGEFIACAMPINNPMSLTVGKVLEVRAGEEGKEMLLRWYIPRTVNVNTQRSKYGKGGWTEEFVLVDGKREASTGWEDVAAVSATFRNLTKLHKLPSHVWKAVSENAQVEEIEEEITEDV